MDEVIINSLVCFINSAKNDFTRETLKDVAYSFYSHEEIKNAKSTLCNLLKKDISWRRDPDKKRKDLNDVLDYHEELTTGRNNWKFLSDSYKGMPPLGMQMLAPLLINLTGEVSRINESLPKFVDMKTEVLNTADTVRKMNMDLIDMKDKFEKAIFGIEEASNDIADEDLNILGELRSFRKSLGTVDIPDSGSFICVSDEEKSIPSSREKETLNITTEPNLQLNDISTDTLVGSSAEFDSVAPAAVIEGVPLQTRKDDGLYSTALKKVKQAVSKSQRNAATGSVRGGGHVSGPKAVSQRGNNNRGRLTGARRDGISSLKAVKRTADVFIGRIDKEADEDVLRDYIKETFNIICNKVEKLQIKTELYNAFKVTVSLSEREALFKSDLWPEDIVINKFYNRSKKTLGSTDS